MINWLRKMFRRWIQIDKFDVITKLEERIVNNETEQEKEEETDDTILQWFE